MGKEVDEEGEEYGAGPADSVLYEIWTRKEEMGNVTYCLYVFQNKTSKWQLLFFLWFSLV